MKANTNGIIVIIIIGLIIPITMIDDETEKIP